MDIDHVVRRVLDSRNIKEYIAEFRVAGRSNTVERIRKRFERLLGRSNVRSVDVEGGVARLVLSAEGMRRLQAIARQRGTTKNEIIQSTAHGGGGT